MIIMKKIDVIIFGGQSNMQGQTEMLTNADIVERAYEYRLLEGVYEPICSGTLQCQRIGEIRS